MSWYHSRMPWYIAGPLIGLFVPALLLLGNRQFGISSNLRHMCAAVLPSRLPFFHYDWKHSGLWNLAFLGGIVLGGAIAAFGIGIRDVTLSPATVTALQQLGVHDFTGLAPRELFSWSALLTWRGAAMILGGGFLVGFGTAWAGGCTSGHAISGLAAFDKASLVAVIGFFAGGLLCTWVLLPALL